VKEKLHFAASVLVVFAVAAAINSMVTIPVVGAYLPKKSS
jgi:hypothetical protein